MGLKLNTLLAKTDHLAVPFRKLVSDYRVYFSREGKSFTGEKNTYIAQPDTVDLPKERGHRIVVTTVDEKLEYFTQTVAEYIDAKFAQEKTNSLGIAKAELIVEGQNWGEYSSLELLALKGLIENGDLVGMYETIPVRSDAETWEDCDDEAYADRAVKQSPLIEGEKKTVEKEQYILSDPNVQYLKDTSKYQPMVASRDTPKKLGDYTFQKFSGEWSATERAKLLRRRTILLGAVIEALKIANEAEVTSSDLSARRIFGYLHGE